MNKQIEQAERQFFAKWEASKVLKRDIVRMDRSELIECAWLFNQTNDLLKTIINNQNEAIRLQDHIDSQKEQIIELLQKQISTLNGIVSGQSIKIAMLEKKRSKDPLH